MLCKMVRINVVQSFICNIFYKCATLHAWFLFRQKINICTLAARPSAPLEFQPDYYIAWALACMEGNTGIWNLSRTLWFTLLENMSMDKFSSHNYKGTGRRSSMSVASIWKSDTWIECVLSWCILDKKNLLKLCIPNIGIPYTLFLICVPLLSERP